MHAYFEQIWYFLSLTDVGLVIVALTSFLAASILPFGSEPYFVAFLELHPESYLIACIIASLGNTLGGLSTWYLGRLSNKIVP
jgi:membrane protein YqaA with SNARE-associated domain